MPQRRVSMQYGFPEMTLEPGEERSAAVEVTGVFRGEKLIMAAFMKPIRGHFKIKRSRLPFLDRDDVVAYTRVYRTRRGFRPGKTTVEFSGFNGGAREYLASSVMYFHTDPLEYIALLNLKIGKEPTMPTFGGGAPAAWFGSNQLGNCLPLPTAEDMTVSLVLKNDGDVQVRVRATILGIGLA